MNNKSTIYIYNDLGASREMVKHTIFSFSNFFSNNQIKTLDSHDLIRGDWVYNASLLVMPGGADLPYVAKLNGAGNNIIKTYVENGGTYLGICAGAYYSSSFVEFDKSGMFEVLGERQLKFFPGKSIGPILAKYSYLTNSGARSAEIETNITGLESFKVYYNGGGYFEKPEDHLNIEIIARYKENNLASIIKTNYGQGKVILSGVHFEVSPFALGSDQYLDKIKPQLQDSEPQREALMLELLGDSLSSADYEYCDDLGV